MEVFVDRQVGRGYSYIVPTQLPPQMTATPTLAQQAADIPDARMRNAFIDQHKTYVEGRWFGGCSIRFPDDSVMTIRGGKIESPLPTFTPKMPTD